jgi:hypothetical protein
MRACRIFVESAAGRGGDRTRSTAGDLPLVISRLVIGAAAVLCSDPFGHEAPAVVLDLPCCYEIVTTGAHPI